MRTFHTVILTFLLFIFSGCGYKADPFYKTSSLENNTGLENSSHSYILALE